MNATVTSNSRWDWLEPLESDVKDEQAQCQGRPTQPLTGIKSYLYVVMPMRI